MFKRVRFSYFFCSTTCKIYAGASGVPGVSQVSLSLRCGAQLAGVSSPCPCLSMASSTSTRSSPGLMPAGSALWSSSSWSTLPAVSQQSSQSAAPPAASKCTSKTPPHQYWSQFVTQTWVWPVCVCACVGARACVCVCLCVVSIFVWRKGADHGVGSSLREGRPQWSRAGSRNQAAHLPGSAAGEHPAEVQDIKVRAGRKINGLHDATLGYTAINATLTELWLERWRGNVGCFWKTTSRGQQTAAKANVICHLWHLSQIPLCVCLCVFQEQSHWAGDTARGLLRPVPAGKLSAPFCQM